MHDYSRTSAALKPWIILSLAIAFSLPATLNAQSFTGSLPASTNVATAYTVSLTAVAQKKPDSTYNGTANVTSTDSTKVSPAAGLPSGCASSCFAALGAGAVLTSTKYGDYNHSSNILQSTHIGASTPQYVAGVAYKLPVQGPLYKTLHCNNDSTIKRSGAQVAYCYPYKAFINLKFSPGSSQAFNGFTYGISHALHQYLDLMVGVSYSAQNEISPGFQQAALNVVKVQQAAKNPYYAQFNLASLEADGPTAYDGFPTQLLNKNGTTGSLIYTGSPTVLHYHTGIFIGIAIPITFKSQVSGN